MNAVITAATKGIGRAIALKLAQQGYDVAICARTKADLDQLQQELQMVGVKVVAEVADCSKKEEVRAFYEKVADAFDAIDVLVNNAGIFLSGNVLDESDEDFELQQHLNVNAAYYLSKYFGRKMRARGSGHIFNICSIASKEIKADAGTYTVTKAALLSLNHVLRKELSIHNIKVTAILPGSTFTASWEGTTIEKAKFVQPEDIAQTLYTVLNLSGSVNVDEIVMTPLNL